MKVVINKCYGGFGVSRAGMMRYAELKGITLYPEDEGSFGPTYYTVPADQRTHERTQMELLAMPQEERADYFDATSDETLYDNDLERDDPALVQVVEELGAAAASDTCSDLRVVEIPDGVEYSIEEYDGMEHVAEAHRTWG